METVGQRIARLRTAKNWSRPELGRKMAEAVGRKNPFSGEVIRLYEDDKNVPGQSARKGLAAVFERPEAYILYGESGSKAEQPAAHYAISSTGEPRKLTAREDILLDLFAALVVDQQRETIDQVRALAQANQILRKGFGLKELRIVSNATVAAAFGPVPPPPTHARRVHPKRKAGGGIDDPDAE